MRGAESSKRFMSYEIYFELEYYYLRSNCNGWARSAHNNNLVDLRMQGAKGPEHCTKYNWLSQTQYLKIYNRVRG